MVRLEAATVPTRTSTCRSPENPAIIRRPQEFAGRGKLARCATVARAGGRDRLGAFRGPSPTYVHSHAARPLWWPAARAPHGRVKRDTMAQREKYAPPATASGVVRIVGPLEDDVIASIVSTGATEAEVLEAVKW